ncbi:hypothetical protein M0G43_01955 [Subsaxibacter sp. CAU 1640]|uniref:hypothetical protein n=1 Tax=Subsaxibacter sp. CAU 1640 TaxID=2933271 RepID=UPI002002E18D|nr:hypothetical protein [Subsaxibacter sp. CAU 1640]MCK7589328.1 hypothetical protein [Subsaxibacter sp. CAU 1640]
MQKRTISYFFLILFTLFIAAPTVISVVEKSFDTSIFYSVNEEENKINETLKVFEVKLSDHEKFCISISDLEKEKSYIFCIKNYTSKDLECLSPPPELS